MSLKAWPEEAEEAEDVTIRPHVPEEAEEEARPEALYGSRPLSGPVRSQFKRSEVREEMPAITEEPHRTTQEAQDQEPEEMADSRSSFTDRSHGPDRISFPEEWAVRLRHRHTEPQERQAQPERPERLTNSLLLTSYKSHDNNPYRYRFPSRNKASHDGRVRALFLPDKPSLYYPDFDVVRMDRRLSSYYDPSRRKNVATR